MVALAVPVALAVLVAHEEDVVASVVVHVAEEASEARAASDQNVSQNQGFLTFCKNIFDFACKCVINVIPLQAKFESTVKWDK